MGLFSKKPKGGGFMDAIRCDEKNYLIWKWHPEGTKEGRNRRENSIRWGSTLHVREGEVAAFVYSQSDGRKIEFIEGPCDKFIETDNFPILASLVSFSYHGDTPFQAEVYFINLAQIIQLRFAIPYFDVCDSRFPDLGVPTAVRGTVSFMIADYREFVRLHRLTTFTMVDFERQIRDAVIRYVKAAVSNAPDEFGIPMIQLERKIDQINDAIEHRVRERLINEFGIAVSSLDIAAIDVDKTSNAYRQLKSLTQDRAAKLIYAKDDVDIKEMRDGQRLGVLEKAGRTLSDIRESSYARRKQTQTANLTAYQLEVQHDVGIAGALGLGSADHGSNASNYGLGMNPASVIAEMQVGAAVGQNIANSVNAAMNNSGAQYQTSKQTVPPPIPVVAYHVAIGGQPSAPCDFATLSRMVQSGTLTEDTLVWKTGMESWVRAGDVTELSALFSPIPPIPNSGIPPVPPG